MHGLRAAAKRTQDAIYDAIVGLLPTVNLSNVQITSSKLDTLEAKVIPPLRSRFTNSTTR
jgi:hypothetical protein